MTDRELMQMAFKAMDSVNDFSSNSIYAGIFDWEVKILRDRLAQPNEFNPNWDAMAVIVEEQQRMAKRIAELEAQLEQEPVYHLRQYGDVTKEQFEHYAQTGSIATPAAQRQHVTDGSLCWCDPETSYTDPETGASVVVHKGPQ